MGTGRAYYHLVFLASILFWAGMALAWLCKLSSGRRPLPGSCPSLLCISFMINYIFYRQVCRFRNGWYYGFARKQRSPPPTPCWRDLKWFASFMPLACHTSLGLFRFDFLSQLLAIFYSEASCYAAARNMLGNRNGGDLL